MNAITSTSNSPVGLRALTPCPRWFGQKEVSGHLALRAPQGRSKPTNLSKVTPSSYFMKLDSEPKPFAISSVYHLNFCGKHDDHFAGV